MAEKQQPQVIYHYCDVHQFMSIVTNGVIWLTDLFQTNDAREGYEFVEAVWAVLEEEGTERTVFEQWRDNFLNIHDFTQGYGFCMSEVGDLLSQWRGYAQNGEGYSIGFDKEKLDARSKEKNAKSKGTVLILKKVEYELDKQKDIVRDIAKHIPGILRDGALLHNRPISLLGIEPDPEEKSKRENAFKNLCEVSMMFSFSKNTA